MEETRTARKERVRVERERASGAVLAKQLRLTVLVLAGVGIILTAYLTFDKWFDTGLAYCAAGSGCDLVQSSRRSTLLGLPLALWGMLAYASIGVLLLLR